MKLKDTITSRMYPTEAPTTPPPPKPDPPPYKKLARVKELIALMREGEPMPHMGPNVVQHREKDLQAAEALELLADLVDKALTASDPRNYGP